MRRVVDLAWLGLMVYMGHVRLTLRDGRRLRLGTRDPQRLVQALGRRIAHH